MEPMMQPAQAVTTIWEGLLRLLSLLNAEANCDLHTAQRWLSFARPLLAIQMGCMCSSADDVQCGRIQSQVSGPLSRGRGGVARVGRPRRAHLPVPAGRAAGARHTHTRVQRAEGPHTRLMGIHVHPHDVFFNLAHDLFPISV